jgi:hypothetical protein
VLGPPRTGERTAANGVVVMVVLSRGLPQG